MGAGSREEGGRPGLRHGPAHIASRAAHVPGHSAPHSPRLPCRQSGLGDGKRCGQSQRHHPTWPCRPPPWLWPPCWTRLGRHPARRRSTPTRTGPREQGHLCDAGRPRGSEFSCVTWGCHVALTELSGLQDVFRAAHPGRRIVPGRDRHARSAAAQGWELCVWDRDVLARVPLGQCWALDGRRAGRRSACPASALRLPADSGRCRSGRRSSLAAHWGSPRLVACAVLCFPDVLCSHTLFPV